MTKHLHIKFVHGATRIRLMFLARFLSYLLPLCPLIVSTVHTLHFGGHGSFLLYVHYGGRSPVHLPLCGIHFDLDARLAESRQHTRASVDYLPFICLFSWETPLNGCSICQAK